MSTAQTQQALQTVLERAVAERDEATAQLYLLLENSRRLGSQREQLVNYRSEYQARWTMQFKQLATMEVVHSYQAFVERLDHAIGQLDQQVLAASKQADHAHAALLARETRVASVRKLLERRLGEAAQKTAAREQRHSDELATMAAWHSTPTLAIRLAR
jgi:flagellar protein FliJ